MRLHWPQSLRVRYQHELPSEPSGRRRGEGREQGREGGGGGGGVIEGHAGINEVVVLTPQSLAPSPHIATPYLTAGRTEGEEGREGGMEGGKRWRLET